MSALRYIFLLLSLALFNDFVSSYAILFVWPTIFMMFVSFPVLTQVFTGNTDATNVVKHFIATPFDSRFVRFYVRSWYNEPALKAEVYGSTTG